MLKDADRNQLDDSIRRVERGSRIVAVVPFDTKLVLQVSANDCGIQLSEKSKSVHIVCSAANSMVMIAWLVKEGFEKVFAVLCPQQCPLLFLGYD